MTRKILITGSKGQIGSVLLGGLRNYILVEADLPETDVRDYATLLKKCKGIDAIIHLAWDTNENHRSKTYNPNNSLMFYNVYKAALELKIEGLAYPDCLDLIEKCLSIKKVPQNYMLIYGVSNNKLGVHDFSNPLGWTPILDAAEFYNWG